ncbi:MAG: hypothetical protein AAF235_02635, partial [Planctomycetota bacterium]
MKRKPTAGMVAFGVMGAVTSAAAQIEVLNTLGDGTFRPENQEYVGPITQLELRLAPGLNAALPTGVSSQNNLLASLFVTTGAGTLGVQSAAIPLNLRYDNAGRDISVDLAQMDDSESFWAGVAEGTLIRVFVSTVGNPSTGVFSAFVPGDEDADETLVADITPPELTSCRIFVGPDGRADTALFSFTEPLTNAPAFNENDTSGDLLFFQWVVDGSFDGDEVRLDQFTTRFDRQADGDAIDPSAIVSDLANDISRDFADGVAVRPEPKLEPTQEPRFRDIVGNPASLNAVDVRSIYQGRPVSSASQLQGAIDDLPDDSLIALVGYRTQSGRRLVDFRNRPFTVNVGEQAIVDREFWRLGNGTTLAVNTNAGGAVAFRESTLLVETGSFASVVNSGGFGDAAFDLDRSSLVLEDAGTLSVFGELGVSQGGALLLGSGSELNVVGTMEMTYASIDIGSDASVLVLPTSPTDPQADGSNDGSLSIGPGGALEHERANLEIRFLDLLGATLRLQTLVVDEFAVARDSRIELSSGFSGQSPLGLDGVAVFENTDIVSDPSFSEIRLGGFSGSSIDFTGGSLTGSRIEVMPPVRLDGTAIRGDTLSVEGGGDGGFFRGFGDWDIELQNDGEVLISADTVIGKGIDNSGTILITGGVATVFGDLMNSGSIVGQLDVPGQQRGAGADAALSRGFSTTAQGGDAGDVGSYAVVGSLVAGRESSIDLEASLFSISVSQRFDVGIDSNTRFRMDRARLVLEGDASAPMLVGCGATAHGLASLVTHVIHGRVARG